MNASDTQRTILIADDDVLLTKLLKYKFVAEGFATVIVHNGEAALEAIDNDKPDLVILDGMMPGMDGFEVLLQIRENDETANIPVIMLTSRGMERDVAAGLALGADEYVVKPFIPDEFIVRVKKVIDKDSA